MAPSYAFVTLLTSDHYLPGALTSIHSLLDSEGTPTANDFDTVCLVTPASVSVETIKALRKVFTLVVGVESIESKSHKELNLLGRPDLVATLTKLHLFRLTQYKKVIFLDADTLIMRPLSHLFNLKEAFSASPDIGWPDCFNSGFMVATPSTATFEELTSMASQRGSWDGGDQGLLNDYFDNWNRLSFTYNVTPSSFYQYGPAMRRYGHGISVVHFIGRHKPWDRLNRSRPGPSSGEAANDYNGLLHRWFDVYESHYGQLSTAAVSQSFASGFQQHQAANFVIPQYESFKNVSYRPPSPEELKTMFGGVLASSSGGVGQYTSMPWAGRDEFIAQSQPSREPSPPAQQQSEQEQQRTPSPPQQIASQHEQRSASPPMLPWNPAISGPDNTQLQMREPLDANYSNVWDDKSRNKSDFFQAPTYGDVPSSIKSHYEQVMRNAPKPARSVFPWEENKNQAKPTRVFPTDPHSVPSPVPQVQAQPEQKQASVPAVSIQQATPPVTRGLPVELNYANAWDSVKGIKKYADNLAKPAPSGSWRVSNSSKGSPEESPSKDLRNRSDSRASDHQGSDHADDEDSEEEQRPVIRYKKGATTSTTSSASSSRGSSATRGALRPYIRRSEGSVGSASRVPTVSNLNAFVEGEKGHKRQQSSLGSIGTILDTPQASPPANSTRLPPASPNLPASRLPAPSPSLASSIPNTRAARVFDASTDTETIKKSGLAALQRFVNSMEKKDQQQQSTSPSSSSPLQRQLSGGAAAAAPSPTSSSSTTPTPKSAQNARTSLA